MFACKLINTSGVVLVLLLSGCNGLPFSQHGTSTPTEQASLQRSANEDERMVTMEGTLKDASGQDQPDVKLHLTYPKSMDYNEVVPITIEIVNSGGQEWSQCTVGLWDYTRRTNLQIDWLTNYRGFFAGIRADSADPQVTIKDDSAAGSILFETAGLDQWETRTISIDLHAVDDGNFLGGITVLLEAAKPGEKTPDHIEYQFNYSLIVAAGQTVREASLVPPSEKTYPVEWPIAPLTEEQIHEVRECGLVTLPSERYPLSVNLREFYPHYKPVKACDWAVLAMAYHERVGKDAITQWVDTSMKNAMDHAIQMNPGFVMASYDFTFAYEDSTLVEAPPFAREMITSLSFRYVYGEHIYYTVNIKQADTDPLIRIDPPDRDINLLINKEYVQALGPALTNLYPVGQGFDFGRCRADFPNWEVTLTFADQTEVVLVADDSFTAINMPWFTEIDGQKYVQAGTAFSKAMGSLMSELDAWFGSDMIFGCLGGSLFDMAYP